MNRIKKSNDFSRRSFLTGTATAVATISVRSTNGSASTGDGHEPTVFQHACMTLPTSSNDARRSGRRDCNKMLIGFRNNWSDISRTRGPPSYWLKRHPLWLMNCSSSNLLKVAKNGSSQFSTFMPTDMSGKSKRLGEFLICGECKPIRSGSIHPFW